jgi:hypothetical protein
VAESIDETEMVSVDEMWVLVTRRVTEMRCRDEVGDWVAAE